MNSMSLATIFQRSYELLKDNLILLVPCLISGTVNVLLRAIFLLQPSMLVGGVVNTMVHWFIYAAAAGIVTLSAVVAVTSMAGRVWEAGSATIDDGIRVLREAGNELYQTLFQIAAIMLLAFILVIPTCGLSIFAAAYLMMYAVTSAVIGHFPGFLAIRESAAIATQRVKQSVGIVIVFVLLTITLWMLTAVLHLIPVVGTLIGAILNQMVLAYMSLVIVGFYISVHQENTPTYTRPTVSGQ